MTWASVQNASRRSCPTSQLRLNTKSHDGDAALLFPHSTLSFRLPESRRTSPHDITLADQFGIEFRTVEREEDIKVDA